MKPNAVRAPVGAPRTRDVPSSTRKGLQSAKIRELRKAVITSGYPTLRQQAIALGLSRSTTWTVLKGNHKGSGLSAAIVKRMLASPQMPPEAKKLLLEYIQQKCAGAYGHSHKCVRKFQSQMANDTWP